MLTRQSPHSGKSSARRFQGQLAEARPGVTARGQGAVDAPPAGAGPGSSTCCFWGHASLKLLVLPDSPTSTERIFDLTASTVLYEDILSDSSADLNSRPTSSPFRLCCIRHRTFALFCFVFYI